MLKIYNFEENVRKFAQKYAPFTNVVGFARSMIAIGTLLTLLVNSVDTLFVRKINGSFITPILKSDFSGKISFFYLFGPEYLSVMKYCAIACLLLVISGYFMKLSSLLHWWITFSFLHSAAIIDGGDQIAAIISFLLIPVCLFDNRRNHWDQKIIKPRIWNLISICFIYIIRLQVAIIYFHAAVGKFDNPEWANGTAIYYWLNHSLFGFPDYLEFTNYFLKNAMIVSALTYGVLILELSLFLALFASMRYRRILLGIALSFHFLIIMYHGIFSFFFSIGGAAILYLYPTYKNYSKNHFRNIRLRFFRKNAAAQPLPQFSK